MIKCENALLFSLLYYLKYDMGFELFVGQNKLLEDVGSKNITSEFFSSFQYFRQNNVSAVNVS